MSDVVAAGMMRDGPSDNLLGAIRGREKKNVSDVID